MALTSTQSKDAYQFFIVAFGAAPGVEYLNQLDDAYGAGMTTKEIVNVYATKPQFLAQYPSFLSNEQFADKLIENVVGASATAAAKTEAKADVVGALNEGWTKGDVVFQIFTNLANKPTTDALWGATAQMFNNKVEVAQYATETLLINTTDLAQLRALVANVTAAPASVDAAKAVAAGATGQTFTLTAGLDITTGTANNDTIVGTFGGAAGTALFAAGDLLDGGAGRDTLTLTAVGTNSSNAITVKNVETINITDTVGAALDAVLIENSPNVNFKNTLNGQTSAVTNAATGSTFGLSGQGDLTVTYAAVTGAADTAQLSLDTTGSATNSVAVNVSSGNAIEAVTVATTGTNFATLTAGTGAKTITVTGNGNNTVVIASSAAALTLDASASVGTNSFNLGAALSGTDTVKGGTGADTLIANITSATQANPTVTGVETINLDFDAAGIFNAANVTGATKLNINGSSAAASVSNLAAAANTLGTTTSNTGTVSVGYAAGAAAAVTYNTGNTGATVTAVSNGGTTFSNIASLTINAAGNSTTGTGALDVGAAATALTLNTAAAANDLTVGAMTGAALQTVTIGATAGDVAVGTLTSGKLTSLAITSKGGADITTGDITAHDGTNSAFNSLSISGEANTTLTIGAITGLTAKNTVSTYNVTLGDTISNSSIGAVTAEAIGNVNVTVGANSTAATLTMGALTADKIGNITVAVGTNNTVAMSADDSGTTNLAIGNIIASGAGTFTFSTVNGSTADTIGTIDLSALAGGSTINVATIDVGTSITGGAGVDNITGTAGADIINGGAGADVLIGSDGADEITGGEGADTITGGAGQDIIDLTEATSAIDTLRYAESAAGNVDTVTGFKVNNDIVSLTIGAISEAGTDITLSTGDGADIAAAVAAGAAVFTAVAKDTAVAADATTHVLKLTATDASSFGTAIGTGSFAITDTAWTAASEGLAATYFDSLNGQVVFGYLRNTDTGTANVINSADTFVEVVRIGMTSADFTAMNNTSFSLF